MRILNTKEAAEFLLEGEIIAYPTETVYGIGGDPFSDGIFEKIGRIKRRNVNQYILLIPNKEWLERLVEEIPTKAIKLIDKFWPGPLTVIFRKKKEYINIPGETIALRISPHDNLVKLFKLYDNPIISTSANISGSPPAKNMEEIIKYFDNKIPGILEGTPSGTQPSTIYDSLTNEILREGAIPATKIREIIT